MHTDLIFDVGMHHGDDSAYYLSQGFRVVGIEANPALAKHCERRFASEIQAGRVAILNIGVGREQGKFPFWVHRVHDEWSSFFRNPSWRDDDVEAITVDCIAFSEVLASYGTPHYLKVDIEGSDHYVVESLNPLDLPSYVSFEGGPRAVHNLCRLAVLGYSSFKVIDQTTHNAPDLSYSNENRFRRWRRGFDCWRWDVTRSLHLDRTPIAALWRSVRDTGGAAIEQGPALASESRWNFPAGSSGPFGEDTPGEWLSLEEVLYNWLHRYFKRYDRGSLLPEPWYDFHARLALAPADTASRSRSLHPATSG
jgi:FkbM family methyltransferase